jgi:hypothetical protein
VSPKVWNKRHRDVPSDAVYVGRPTEWGNDFIIGRDGDRVAVIRKYRDAILQDPAFLEQIRRELAGKDLVCWCAPAACHADVLLEIANGDQP